MHWILQDNFLSYPGRTALIQALDRFGFRYSVHRVVPKVGDLIPEPKLEHQNVICFGSYSLRPAVIRHQWTPGLFDIFAQDFEKQREHWGSHMLNFDSIVCCVKDAVFAEERMFVRPVNDSKYFSGKVVTADEFAVWQRVIYEPDIQKLSSLTPETRIQLARPLAIQDEYRFWIVKGEVVTQSVYRRGGEAVFSADVDAPVRTFVEERIREWLPHETFVIDVCETPDGIKIVEVNTLNCSALYAADVQRLVLALENGYGSRVG